MNATAKRNLELLEMPCISSQFPVVFDNGARWDGIKGNCNRCKKEIPDENMRGLVVQHTPQMVSVEACGFCSNCNLISSFVYRMYDDRRVTGQQGGVWRTWTPKMPWYRRFLKNLQRFLNGNK